MKYALKIGYHTKLLFSTLKEATKAMEAISRGIGVEEKHCTVNGRYCSVFFPGKKSDVQLLSVDDDQLRAVEPTLDDDGNEIGRNFAAEIKRKPVRRGLLLPMPGSTSQPRGNR